MGTILAPRTQVKAEGQAESRSSLVLPLFPFFWSLAEAGSGFVPAPHVHALWREKGSFWANPSVLFCLFTPCVLPLIPAYILKLPVGP